MHFTYWVTVVLVLLFTSFFFAVAYGLILSCPQVKLLNYYLILFNEICTFLKILKAAHRDDTSKTQRW